MANGDNGTDIGKISARLPAIFGALVVVVPIIAGFITMGSKIDTLTKSSDQMRVDNNIAHSAIVTKLESADMKIQAQERLIVELTTTLRVKGIIR